MTKLHPTRRSASGRQGFSILETLIAIVVIMVGLLALLAALAMALSSTQNTKSDQIARERAVQTIESIYTARETNQIGYTAIQNQPAGIFVAGMVPLTDAGPDGIVGTNDDVPAAPINVPGPSGVLTGNSPPDVQISLASFQRQIIITTDPTNGNLRDITVTIQYPAVQGGQRTYTVHGMISAFR